MLSSKEFPRFYGRRIGRKLSKSGILALKAGSKYILQYDKFSEDFLNFNKKIVLEIGFGDGKNLINSAKQNPEILYLGADPFLNTTVKCIKQILENNINNIKIWPDDIRKILDLFPSKSISEIKLLFPDPWPKLKHQNRRLIQINFINSIYKILKSWILEKFQANNKFEWLVETSKDWQNRPKDCFLTKYEEKALNEKRIPSWFVFKKK